MIRKDCGNKVKATAERALLVVMVVCLVGASDALAGSIRLWPTALVVSDAIRLDDVCELSGFTAETSEKLSRLIVAGAPVAGGSRVVSIDLVRSVVQASGTNLARVTIGGAMACEVSRPSQIAPSQAAPRATGRTWRSSNTRRNDDYADTQKSEPAGTLRQAVIDFCNAQVSRFGGTADVTFDRTSDRLLQLAEPQYGFKVRSREPVVLGLVPLEVDVVAGKRFVQTVAMVVQVTMNRSVLVARRTINQGASIASTDLELVDLSFSRADAIGLVDAAQAIGQRARRVIPVGTAIQADMLEPVPVVRRGQLVTLTSVSGSIQVVTTGKAGADGLVGDVIKVRSVEDRRVEYDAVVTGPGRVQIGGTAARSNRVALGGGL